MKKGNWLRTLFLVVDNRYGCGVGARVRRSGGTGSRFELAEHGGSRGDRPGDGRSGGVDADVRYFDQHQRGAIAVGNCCSGAGVETTHLKAAANRRWILRG